MGVSVFPAAAGGGIKTVQRGSAGASGNVTITAVDIAKSFVTVFGSASAGTVSASFGLSIAAGNIALIGDKLYDNGPGQLYRPTGASGIGSTQEGTYQNLTSTGYWSQSVASNIGAATVNAGSNNLVAAAVTGFLANTTTLTVSGACRYEVVEFA